MSEEFKEPESVKGLFYYTFRDIGEGNVLCWVDKLVCPKCGKAKMSKPRKEDGKVKTRAKKYVCPECGYAEDKKEYEDKLKAKIKYKCPHCGFEGQTIVPFKRKTIKSVKTLRFFCEKCNEPIDITKKFKKKKTKK
jgi:predicted RNA-binding Zn-ribbon protein involved in translation (DUF1610 family)